MKLLEEKIVKEGKWVGEGILKVDSFLNHQVDVEFVEKIGEEIARIYKDEKIDRILTAETSGIVFAAATSRAMGYIPMVFAKKNRPSTMVSESYKATAKSFTKGTDNSLCVSKDYLPEGENVLIVDDFLARGESGCALCDLVVQAGANIVGYTAIIEKLEQGGANKIRNAYNCNVRSLAVIEQMQNGEIISAK